ncbi:MAG: DEAD/DEAH box helicase [Bacteroidota bacterium]|nr:DEAD/DEAH box helicase [Bacteroidota bacterium]MED5335689.1 DEAD/DEAH box helicase [Bacteroidota bacterium]
MTFSDLKVTRQYLDALEDMGIFEPTEIQSKAIPRIRAGQDVIGIAQTGTGKTLAFLLPLMAMLSHAQGQGPRCVILTPAKELALQIAEVAKRLAARTDLRVEVVYGGVGHRAQQARLEEGCDLVVATPGRFMELYLRQAFQTGSIAHLVLDEADRMMDLGFMPQLRKLLEILPTKRQNLLFSATYPPKTEAMAGEFLLWPTRVEASPQSTPVETVIQSGYRADNFGTKLNLLSSLLNALPEETQALLFVREKDQAERIGQRIAQAVSPSVRTLHANKGQNSRIHAMDQFKEGELRFLVATDVASRGIDVPQLDLVINVTVPRDPHDYIHRIGRTGRAKREGRAITMIDPSERAALQRIEGLLGTTLSIAPLPEDITVESTPKWEAQAMARAVDREKRKADPNFKGAFHEKKRKPSPSRTKGKKRRR